MLFLPRLTGGYHPAMRTVAVCVPEACASIGTTGLRDALAKADRSWQVRSPESFEPLFDVRFVALRGGSVECEAGVFVRASGAADMERPDIALVPGLDDDVVPSFERNRKWAPWLARWHSEGTIVAASCTGAFLLAEAGLLDGRAATTHWFAAGEFSARFPRVHLTADRMLIDDGDVITSGGATTFLNLALHLVGRFGGPERAAFAAKVLLIDGDRRAQAPYMAPPGRRDHGDPLVHAVQDTIERQLSKPIAVPALALAHAISERTLHRRFRETLGLTPGTYVREARMDRARALLEATSLTIGHVADAVGYMDEAAFRRAFQAEAGISPARYRAKFQQPSSAK